VKSAKCSGAAEGLTVCFIGGGSHIIVVVAITPA
jgi:hypothetical protein